MGLPSKTVNRGFTLTELLVAMAIASLVAMLVAALFHTGLFHIRRSSGRIDLMRRVRHCMDNTQRYLSAAVKPNTESGEYAVFYPETFSDDETDQPQTAVGYWTPVDFLGGASLPSARALQANPAYYRYELAEIPGELGRGNDVVLRRLSDFGVIDSSVTPRVIGRDLGWRDSSGEYVDGFVVRYLRVGALRLDVTASGSRVHDSLERQAVTSSSGTSEGFQMVVRLTTIIQLPYYSNN